MCESCGCGSKERHLHKHDHDHVHEHGHETGHAHDHGHTHQHPHPRPQGAPAGTVQRPAETGRIVSLASKVLSRNDAVAAENRTWLEQRGVVALNLISSPGTGKTLLLERTLERLRGRIACAVIAGDQQTDNDARRLSGKGAAVHQIETVSSCHLNAEQVREALPRVVLEDTRLLFIENVGNLVCPSAFDLGETCKVALVSVTEGEDKPEKYPSIFSQAPVVVLTKTDLIPHLDWDMPRCRASLRKVCPGAFVFQLSARTGEGMDAWIDYLERLV